MEKIVLSKSIIPQFILMKEERNPIFIWGVGALARNVYNYCMKFDINVGGFFVNVSGNLNSMISNIPVYDIEKLVEQYSRFSVVIGHANYAEGIEFLKGIDNVEKIYCLKIMQKG